MTLPARRALLLTASAALIVAACAPPDRPRSERAAGAYLRLLAAEDARPESGPDLELVREATRRGDVFLRQVAVRALGRLESPDLVPDILPLLDDRAVAVRAEAVNALAQSAHRQDGDEVVEILLARAPAERDSLVLASLARSLGRAASSAAYRARAAAALAEISRRFGDELPLSTAKGVALGFESLVRGAQGRGVGGEAAAALVDLTTYGNAGLLRDEAAPVRRLAYTALGQARRLDLRLIERILADPHPSVRMLGASYLEGIAPGGRVELIRRTLGDQSLQAPIEAVRAVAREPRTITYCRFLFAAAADAVHPAIRVPAMDALAEPCPQSIEQRVALQRAAAAIGDAEPEAWQPHAHALVALAGLAPEEAAGLVPAFASHANPFARAWGAQAAGIVADTATLRGLASDPAPNVRTAAIQGLFTLEGHDADDVLLAQLEQDDPQLLMTAARLLEGAPEREEASSRLVGAFERISAARRETWRDARRALLRGIAELGSTSLSPRLEPFLSDYDALVAADVAAMLTSWDGRARTPSPVPLPRMPLPTPEEYRALEGAQVVLHMRSGPVVIDLFPELATTNVFRFVRLAESGYFDGLTFHRWAPNFVLQGGSPNANEYQGDGPYSRDEVGLQPHWRGTVGISTRGRDTGDGQIFINLVDNARLDHDYTVVGRVVEGMDVVDFALEGAVIDRAEVRRGG